MAIAALLVLLLIAGGVGAHPPADEPTGQGEVTVTGVTTPLLQYQGRLTDPSTGEPVDGGDYTMTFRLYDAASGGSPLWTETKDVSVQDGLFSTVLGDATPLDQGLFNGQELWLGIKVMADAEATPRQQVLPVAYALSLLPGAVISATSSSPILRVNNVGSGEALRIGGPTVLDGDLTVSGSLIGGSHAHSGGDITSGTIAEARIDDEIARDPEVTSAIGTHAGDPDAHHARYTDSEAWDTVLDRDGAGSGLDADLLDGSHAAAFLKKTGPDGMSGSSADPILTVVQNGAGYAGYFRSASGLALYAVGNATVTGDLKVGGNMETDRVVYSSPRTQYFVIGGEGFVPGSSAIEYLNTYGMGGACIQAGYSGALVAPVHLPQGAEVTAFTVFFNDVSANNIDVRLDRLSHGGGYTIMASVSSSGIPGYGSQTDTTISLPIIDNTTGSYHVYAYYGTGDCNIKVMGALIEYTVSEAQ